jgi:hypothetical protein
MAGTVPPARQTIVAVPPGDVAAFRRRIGGPNPTRVPAVARPARNAKQHFNQDIRHADQPPDADFHVHADSDTQLPPASLLPGTGRACLGVAPTESLKSPAELRSGEVNAEQIAKFPGPGEHRDVVSGRQAYSRDVYPAVRSRTEAAHEGAPFGGWASESCGGCDGYMPLGFEALQHHNKTHIAVVNPPDVQVNETYRGMASGLAAHGVQYSALAPAHRQGDGRSGKWSGCQAVEI